MDQTRSIADRLSIITTTHLIPSAPSVAILRGTVERLRRRLPVAGCRHMVYYDAPADGGGSRGEDYLRNLRRLCERQGTELYVRPGLGLKANMLEGLATVTTSYALFLEHDWVFRQRVDLAGLLDVFDRHNFVNIVRFNKFWNDSYYMWDHLVEPEDRVAELALTRTSSWSNNPHVMRVEKWRHDWLPIVGTERAGGSYGVEEKLYWAYNREIFTRGFHVAHADWGSYLYGGLRDGCHVYHTNGSGSLGAALDYLAKLRRLVSRGTRRLHATYSG
ncbi:hypothetical protein BH23PLA1_BH23PLA1_00010 [soil metagenome]